MTAYKTSLATATLPRRGEAMKVIAWVPKRYSVVTSMMA